MSRSQEDIADISGNFDLTKQMRYHQIPRWFVSSSWLKCTSLISRNEERVGYDAYLPTQICSTSTPTWRLFPTSAGYCLGGTRGKSFLHKHTKIWCSWPSAFNGYARGGSLIVLMFKLSPTFSNFYTQPKLPKFGNSPVSQKKKYPWSTVTNRLRLRFVYGESPGFYDRAKRSLIGSIATSFGEVTRDLHSTFLNRWQWPF